MKLKLNKGLTIAAGTILCLGLVILVRAKVEAVNDTLSVINITTNDKPGYSVYWPKDKGPAKVEKAKEGETVFNTIAETDLNYYTDYDVVKNETYVYKVTIQGNTLVANSSDVKTGKPTISSVKIDAGTANKTQASVIVSFKTDRLAKSQVYYGTSLSYESQTELSQDLNQSHTILIEKLKPSTTYHFKVRATDKLGSDSTETEDLTVVTPTSPPDQSLLEIIIKALTQAFSGFEKWLKS